MQLEKSARSRGSGSATRQTQAQSAEFASQGLRIELEKSAVDGSLAGRPQTRTLGLLPKILAGTHVGEKEVSHVGVRKVTIEATAPVPSHLDGEVMPPMTRFEIELVPAALDLL